MYAYKKRLLYYSRKTYACQYEFLLFHQKTKLCFSLYIQIFFRLIPTSQGNNYFLFSTET